MPKAKAELVAWPECQTCMDCPYGHFIDMTIDGKGSYYVCVSPEKYTCEVERKQTISLKSV